MKKSLNRCHPIDISVGKELSNLNINKVIVALSGGADSVATLCALRKAGCRVKALHCNFHLRKEESNRDMDFVKKLCLDLEVPLEIAEFNIDEYRVGRKGISVEMACRDLRHDWFRQRLAELSFDRIATGHNADDNIETFFLNAFRGSGSRGLKGMTPDNGIIWRPLLKFHRKDILDYLDDNDLEYVVDSSNLENDYRRNILRNQIIPLLKKEWKGFENAMDKTIANLETENSLIEKIVEETLSGSVETLTVRAGKEANVTAATSKQLKTLRVDTVTKFPAPLLLIKRFIDPLEPFTTTPQEILAAVKANKPHIRRWRLRNGKVFLRNGRLFIEMIHCE